MNSTLRPYRLLAPGPVPVPETVMHAMSSKVLHHRTPEFLKILKSVWSDLKLVFDTEQPVTILTGTGSAAMEAAVVNSLKAGDHALVVVSGKFGERWAEICERYHIRTIRWDVAWGESLDLAAFESTLKQYPDIKTVFTQACETSTATLHPIYQMSDLVKKNLPQALFAVDAITAVGCMELPMDAWNIDIMVGGSQKAFMIPTGLSFVALSERAWARQNESLSQKFYLDLASEAKANAKGDSQFSIPTPLMTGLSVVLENLRDGSRRKLLQNRCALLASITRDVGVKLGLSVYSKSPAPSVTALSTNSDSAALRDRLEKEFNITVMGGQDQLKGKILRVGHMGDVRDEDMLAFFNALSECLGKSGDWNQMKASTEARLKEVPPLFA